MTEQLKPSGRFTKKPVTIDAWRIDLDNAQPDWVRTAFGHDVIDWSPDGEGLYINTLDGLMVGNIGDWLIRGIKEELYACKSEIFDATYSPADEGAQPAQAVPVLTRDDIVSAWLAVEHITHATQRQEAFARQIEQAVRARMGVGVPMTDEARKLRSLLGAALGALRYHTEQTRPIQRTKETIGAIERELDGIVGKEQP